MSKRSTAGKPPKRLDDELGGTIGLPNKKSRKRRSHTSVGKPEAHNRSAIEAIASEALGQSEGSTTKLKLTLKEPGYVEVPATPSRQPLILNPPKEPSLHTRSFQRRKGDFQEEVDLGLEQVVRPIQRP